MAYEVTTREGGGTEGVADTEFSTPAFNLKAAHSVVVAVFVSATANIVGVTDTAGNTYSPVGPQMDSETTVGEAAGAFVQFFRANNTVANAANVVTAEIDSPLEDCVVFAWQATTGPLGIPLGFATNAQDVDAATGADVVFSTPVDNALMFAVGWKPGATAFMIPSDVNYSGDPSGGVYGGFLSATHAVLTAQETNRPAYFASSAGETEIFLIALQANDISAVVASHPAGNYDTAINVALELDYPRSGVEIRYTTDGSDPDAADTLYAGPIAIAATTTLKASGFDVAGNLEPGPVSEWEYTFVADVGISNVVVTPTVGGDGRSLRVTWDTVEETHPNAFADDGTNPPFPAGENGYSLPGTSHSVVITGLTPDTEYSVTVESGGKTSAPVVATTESAAVRGSITEGSIGASTIKKGTGFGDVYHNFIGADDVCRSMNDDPLNEAGVLLNNFRFVKFNTEADEVTFDYVSVNELPAFGGGTTSPSNDGLNGEALTYKGTWYTRIADKDIIIVSKQRYGGDQYCWYPFTILSDDDGATFNNSFEIGSPHADGNAPPARRYMWRTHELGWVAGVVYGKDDGTLGHGNPANAFDGGDEFIYTMRHEHFLRESDIYFGRQPRSLFAAQSDEGYQFWTGGILPPETTTDEAIEAFVDNANWSKNRSDATPMLTDANEVGGSSMVFLPGPNCYIMLTFAEVAPGDTSQTKETLRTGPTPVGPWAILDETLTIPNGYYGPAFMHRPVAENEISNGEIVLAAVKTNDFNNYATGFDDFYRPNLFDVTLTAVTEEEGGGGEEPINGEINIQPRLIALPSFGNVLFKADIPVDWSVESGGGSISPEGLYTAPVGAATVTVRATAQADSENIDEVTFSVAAATAPYEPGAFAGPPSFALPRSPQLNGEWRPIPVGRRPFDFATFSDVRVDQDCTISGEYFDGSEFTDLALDEGDTRIGIRYVSEISPLNTEILGKVL